MTETRSCLSSQRRIAMLEEQARIDGEAAWGRIADAESLVADLAAAIESGDRKRQTMALAAATRYLGRHPAAQARLLACPCDCGKERPR